jgi:hypothetical protein
MPTIFFTVGGEPRSAVVDDPTPDAIDAVLNAHGADPPPTTTTTTATSPADVTTSSLPSTAPFSAADAPDYSPTLPMSPLVDVARSGATTRAATKSGGATPPTSLWAPQEQLPPMPEDAPEWARFADYPNRRIIDMYNAAGRVGGDIWNDLRQWENVPGQADVVPPTRSLGDIAWDLAQTGGALASLAAPQYPAAGLAAGGAMQALHLPDWVAPLADLTLNVGGGIKNIAQGIKEASPAADIKALEAEYGGVTPPAAGRYAQETAGTQLRDLTTRVDSETWQPLKAAAAERNVAATPEQMDALRTGVQRIQEQYGDKGLLSASDQRVLEELRTRITPSEPEAPPATGLVDPQGRPVASTTAPVEPTPVAPLTYAEADDLYHRLILADADPSALKGLLAGQMHEMLGDHPDLQLLRQVANQRWMDEVAPSQKLAGQLGASRLAGKPWGAFRLIGGKDIESTDAAANYARLADETGQTNMQRAWYTNFFRKLGGEAKNLPTQWKKVSPEMKALIDPTGEFDTEVSGLKHRVELGAKWANRMGIGALAGLGGKLVASGNIHLIPELLLGENLFAKRAASIMGALVTGVRGGARPFARMALASAVPMTTLATAATQTLPSQLPSTTTSATTPSTTTSTTLPPAAQSLGDDGPFKGQPWNREANAIARKLGVPPELAAVVLEKESQRNPRAVSPQGAIGLMQLMPSTFQNHADEVRSLTGRDTADIWDPIDNLIAGNLELRDWLRATQGSVRETAQGYHGGADRRQWGPKTQAYGEDVVTRLRGVPGLGG